jgi:hypothetical protein
MSEVWKASQVSGEAAHNGDPQLVLRRLPLVDNLAELKVTLPVLAHRQKSAGVATLG